MITHEVTNFQGQIAFMAPVGLNGAVTAAALQDHTSRSEFLRRAVIARLREVGVPLESGKRSEADRAGNKQMGRAQ
jgi:hypothetical protein